MGNTSPTESTVRLSGADLQAAGFGCLLAWTSIVFFSRLVHYSTRNDISHLNSTYSFACCGIVVATIAAAFLFRAARPNRDGAALDTARPGFSWDRAEKAGVAASALLLSACTFVLTLIERGVFMQPWCSITSTAAGICLGVLMLAWAQEFVRTARSFTPVRIALPFTLGAALFVAVLYLPEALGIASTVLLPLASLACLFALRSRAASGGDALGAECVATEFSGALTPAYARTLVSIGMLALAESLARALFLDVDPASDSTSYRWLFLCATVASAALVVAAGARSSASRAIRTTNRACMFAMTTLTLLAPIVCGLSLAADLPTLVCYCLFNMIVWIYLTMTARAYRVDPRVLFGFGLGAAYGGCLAGTFLGGVLASFFTLSWRASELVALACALLILSALLFIADERVFLTLVDADDERPQAPRRFRLRIDSVARAHGLTAKETEVLVLAAKGRTTARICEELGVSTGTVNTHLAHIYKKLDVHDRQQLLDMLDGRSDG